MDFSSFPTEIQDLIFDHVVAGCSRKELKAFRGCARYFRDRADIHLFHTLHISASTKSFERLQNVASNKHLGCHVKELVFHRGTFSGHHMVRSGGATMWAKDYGDFEGWMIRNIGPSQAFLRISASYTAFNAEVESERMFNRSMTWQDDLKKACYDFPKLAQLTTLESDADLDSEYLRRRCGLTYQSSTPGYFAPYEILEPCGKNFKPRALTLDWVNGEDFASMMTSWEMRKSGPDAVKEKFSELIHFRLSFSETVNSLPLEGTWDNFIQACVNLRSLSLDLNQFYTSTKILKNSTCFSQRLVRLVLNQHFPDLQHLTLEYAMMTEDDFVAFLSKHEASLSCLRLTAWPMPVTEQGTPTGSVIRAFHQIGQLPMRRLSSVSMSGTFSSRADGEGWDVYCPDLPDIQPERLVHRLERYLTRQTDAFPFATILSDRFNKPRLTVSELTELDETPAKMGMHDLTFKYFHNFASGSGSARMCEFDARERDYPSGPFASDDNSTWQ